MSIEAKLHTAIQAAKDGQRDTARRMLLEVLDQEPDRLLAWLWLSEVLEDPAQRISALENAALLRPGDAQIQNRIDALRKRFGAPAFLITGHQAAADTGTGTGGVGSSQAEQIQSLEEKLNQAYRLSEAGQAAQAVILLQEVIVQEPDSERAWLLLAETYSNMDDRVRALERAAKINPGRKETVARLANLREASDNPLQRAKYLEERGETNAAVQTYISIITHSRSAAERVEAQRRIEALSLRQEAHEIQPVKPSMNLIRLALGPVFLFVLMVLMQSGLNPLRAPILAFLGVACVSAGGLLISAAEMRPAHPLWVKWFGVPGTGDEPEMRRGLHLLGLALLLGPYAIFFIEAGQRLSSLQASMMVP